MTENERDEAKILKQTLYRLRINPFKLSKAIGVSPSTVHRHVNGERKITWDLACLYSLVLGIPMEELRPDLVARARKAQAALKLEQGSDHYDGE